MVLIRIRKSILIFVPSIIFAILSSILFLICETDAFNYRRSTQFQTNSSSYQNLSRRHLFNNTRNIYTNNNDNNMVRRNKRINHNNFSDFSFSSLENVLVPYNLQLNKNNNSNLELRQSPHSEEIDDEAYESIEPETDNDDEESNNHRNFNQNLSPSRRFQRQHLYRSSNGVHTLITDNSIKKDLPKCLTCTNEQQIKNIPLLTMREMRLEYIKQQILHKLRLEEPPTTNTAENIPDSVQLALHNNNPTSHSQQDQQDYFEDDNSYGKTEQIIVFPEEVHPHCSNVQQSVCLTFIVPNEIHVEKVSSAELWGFTSAKPLNRKSRMFLASEISNNNSIFINKEELRGTQEQWVKLNVTKAVSSWSLSNFSKVLSKSEVKTLRIVCENCEVLRSELPIDVRNVTRKPFLIVNMADTIKKKRSRRNINCSPGVSRCCRERLEVDFAEFGWNWIVAPKKYDAYFCKGSCFDAIGHIPNADKHHLAYRQNIIHSRGLNNHTELLLPCCAATKMSGISLLYIRSNGTIFQDTLPNMVVESCGCH